MKGKAMLLSALTVILTMGASMSATAAWFGHSKGWKEEVQLHDGRVLVVERTFNLGGYPTLDARERALLDETISFTLPGTSKTISWKTEFRQDLPEPNSLGALLLDVIDGVPYLATSPAGCIAYNKWGRPNPPYVLFKYVDDTWQRISLNEFPSELVEANLMNMPASSLLKPYYTVAASKAHRQNGNMSAYAKSILREPVKGGDAITSCPDFSSQRYRSPKAPLPMLPSGK
ncbi:MAG: hypothetical protein KJ719_06955 [Gammaproteobacteria bacterium]|nr:hypothetical protein [Rhodocyclaceae bacterium]MBU3907886.1 hypothetical protein [Gammaproteobacteria bacterium]MBU3990919.1 hypothetical protein [Gammaproteobacteria bacterium]MBU4095980.1 hypothetical protein [Gammaproteobacteria bacterium]